MGGGDKHGQKNGRYVGGFLQLFDWNAKSRKKLFSTKSDIPEEKKQGKKAFETSPMTRIHVDEDEEFGTFDAGLSVRGGCDYSCASSVTDDDGFGTKAPGVVARLMGLDSLPITNATEPFSSTPLFDSISLQEAPIRGREYDLYHDHQIMHLTHQTSNPVWSHRIDNTNRNTGLESRSLKFPNRPIEKFQTEILPPKSAKTIPITHHKLLSPIKSPIFVPSQDAAYIMEAAARIIDPGPSAISRAKLSSAGSSTVPLKVRKIREKLEAAQIPAKASEQLQRPLESKAAKYLKGQPMNKSWNGSDEMPSYRASPSREDNSTAPKNKGKSISLAIQAKVNVQKRGGLASSSKCVAVSEEKDGNKSPQLSRNQTSAQKLLKRKPLNQSNSSVLKQNNQKQNCPSSHSERSVLKASISGKKSISEDTSISQLKTVARETETSRLSSRKPSLPARRKDKDVPSGGGRNNPTKKRSRDGGVHFNKNQVTENVLLTRKNEKSSNSSEMANKQFTWIEESRRKGLDVVSFTFSAPMTRSQPGFEPSKLASKGCSDEGSKMLTNSDLTRLSSPGLNGIKGDALSKLLEQKLKELASNLEVSDAKSQTDAPGSAESSTGKAREILLQQEPLVVDMNSQIYTHFFANEDEQTKKTMNFQVGAVNDTCNGNKAEAKRWNDHHLPSPISILEPSIQTESCCSSDSIASSITEVSRLCSSVQAQDAIGSNLLHHSDLSDSASSTSSQVTTENASIISTSWELDYIKDILCIVESMFKDYASGRTREVINPLLFDQMERRRAGKGELQRERKVMFDCVCECLNLKCQSFANGGFDMWIKGITTLKRKERLAEEVYKEIQEWRNLGNSMVDELVDKDMSSKYGRWLDFGVDEFALGVEIEGQILDSLVGEMVFDILF